MCQSKAAGGRRCASHHPLSQAVKLQIAKDYGLTASQTQFLFSQAMAESRASSLANGGGAALQDFKDASSTEYEETLGSVETLLRASNSPSRRAQNALAKAGDMAQTTTPIVNKSLLALPAKAAAYRQEVDSFIASQAETRGISRREAKEMLDTYVANTVSSPSPQVGMDSLDPQMLQAMEAMKKDAPQPVFEQTPRITQFETPRSSTLIEKVGHSEDGRLEMYHRNGSVYTFRNVNDEMYQQVLDKPISALRLMNHLDYYQYSNPQEAETDGYRVQCPRCGQFQNASGHLCPVTGKEEHVLVPNLQSGQDPEELYKAYKEEALAKLRTEVGAGVEEHEDINAKREIDSGMSLSVLRGGSGTVIVEETLDPQATRNGSSNVKVIYPDRETMMQAIKDGAHEAQGTIIRRIPRADGEGFYELQMGVSLVNDNGRAGLNTDFSSARCTCEQYQTNGRCSHLYPSSDNPNRLNNYFSRDVEDFISSVEIRAVLAPTREDAELGKVLTEEALDGVAAELIYNNHVDTRVPSVFYDEGIPLSNGGTYLSLDGQMLNINHPERENSPVREFYAREISRRLPADSRFRQREVRTYGYQQPVEDNSPAARLERLSTMDNTSWEFDSAQRQEIMNKYRGGNPDGFMANPESFVNAYRQGQSEGVEYQTQTGFTKGLIGTGPDDDAPGFGVEIEFDVDGDSRSWEIRSEIARELHEAGLSDYSYAEEYHTQDYSTWVVEEDCSVSGEIVSPILYDNEDSWNQLAKVCEIAKRHGATASVRTGQHVHVGGSSSNAEERRAALIATATFQDTIRRVATNPQRGTHRTSGHNNDYSAPVDQNFYEMNTGPNASSRDLSYYAPRYMNINLQNSNTVEFRDGDGSLDPAHIQAQVLMSAAVMSRARSLGSDIPTPSNIQEVGKNKKRYSHLEISDSSSDEAIIASNLSAMAAIDSLFDEPEHRDFMAKTLSKTSWQD